MSRTTSALQFTTDLLTAGMRKITSQNCSICKTADPFYFIFRNPSNYSTARSLIIQPVNQVLWCPSNNKCQHICWKFSLILKLVWSSHFVVKIRLMYSSVCPALPTFQGYRRLESFPACTGQTVETPHVGHHSPLQGQCSKYVLLAKRRSNTIRTISKLNKLTKWIAVSGLMMNIFITPTWFISVMLYKSGLTEGDIFGQTWPLWMHGNVNITHYPFSTSSSSSSCCRNNSDWNHHGNRISTWKQGCGEAGGGGMERQRAREWERGLGPLITQHDLWRSGKEHLQRVHSSHWKKRIWGIKGQAAIQQADSFSLFAPSFLSLSSSLSPNFSFFPAL